MLKLVSVHMQNFRVFTDATFEPDLDGITAISGVNGAGKSTIAIAILFSLYGVPPKRVKIGDLRKQGTTEPAVVETTLLHNNEQIVITRTIRGKNNDTTASIKTLINGEYHTEEARSSSKVNEKIVRMLGLDAEAFLSAFLIRQKELDALIKSDPAIRRKTIERLAGIERMSKALEKARGEVKNHKKLLQSLPDTGDLPSQVEQLAATVAETIERQHATERTLADMEHQLADINALITTAHTTRETLKKQVADATQHEAELRDLTTRINSLDEQETRLVNIVGYTEDLPERVVCEKELASLEKTYEEMLRREHATETLRERQRELLAEKRAEETNQSELNRQHELAQQTLEQHLAHAPSGEPKTELEERLTALREQLASLQERHAVIKANQSRLAKASETLTGTHNECPTCLTPLTDPHALREQFEVELRALTAEESAVVNEGKSVRGETLDVERRISQWEEHANQTVLYTRNVETAVKESAEASRRVAETERQLRLVEQNLRDAENTSTVEQKNEVRNDISFVRNQLNLWDQVAQATQDLSDLSDRREALANERNTREENYAKLNVDVHVAQRLEEATEQAETLIRDREQLNQRKFALMSEHSQQAITVEKGNQRIRELGALQAQKDEVVHALQVAESTAFALDDFRKDRVARLAPELSEIASDILSETTDGFFVSLTLDDEFTPYVTTKTGLERPVSWLSGGEESAVAFALRVAIADVISFGNPGFLYLDEVTTAQDVQRRESFMRVVSSIPRQIITVSHTADATDVVNRVYTVLPETDGSETGSVIVESGDVSQISDDLTSP